LVGALVLGLGLMVQAFAERRAAAEPLGQARVVASALKAAPTLLAGRKDLEVAEAERLAADGGFDPIVRARGAGTALGSYSYARFDASYVQPTPWAGLSLLAGYRVGGGPAVPVYDAKIQTDDYGEVRAGATWSLARDFGIDARRAAVGSAALAPELATLGLTAQRLEIARAAGLRYWAWVEAGQALSVARESLALATTRDAALAERVAHGELPPIERDDNARALLARKAAVVAAERALASAALELSLLLRDERGAPVVPTTAELPVGLVEPSAGPLESEAALIAEATSKRPDLRRLALGADLLRIEERLAENARRPAIDLGVSFSRELGGGVYAKAPWEGEVTLSIDLPVLARSATGKARAARAKIEKNELLAVASRERIAADVRDALLFGRAARERRVLADKEAAIAGALAEKEREAFALGHSTILTVNLREQAAIDAELRAVVARIDVHRAALLLDWARGRLVDRVSGA
jgi:outer membrane protein TolC